VTPAVRRLIELLALPLGARSLRPNPRARLRRHPIPSGRLDQAERRRLPEARRPASAAGLSEFQSRRAQSGRSGPQGSRHLGRAARRSLGGPIGAERASYCATRRGEILKSTSLPYFNFYARDFLARAAQYSLAERGAVVSVYAWQWENGPLPDEPARLARIVGCLRVSSSRSGRRSGASSTTQAMVAS
jgi:hypothetical protein